MQWKPEDKKRPVIIQQPNTLFSLPITPTVYTYNPTHELEERKIKFSVVLSTSLKLVTRVMTTCIDFVLSYINSLSHSINGELQYLTMQVKQVSFRVISWQRQVSTLILSMCSLCYGRGPLLETNFQNCYSRPYFMIPGLSHLMALSLSLTRVIGTLACFAKH